MGIPIGIPGIHLPKKKPKDDAKSKVTVESVDGSLRKLNEKDLLLQTSGGKILRFRLIAKTEFRGKDGKPVRDSLLHPGDHLTIDVNPDDTETALHVILNKSGSDHEREVASDPVQESRIMTPDSSDFGRPHSVNSDGDSGNISSSGSSGSGSSDDRPTLHRKVDSEKVDSEEDAPPSSSAAPSAPAVAAAKPPASEDNSTDAVIGDARDAAASYTADLPNFLVQQITTRYTGSRYVDNWRVLDTVTADVSSVNGKEEYKNIRVNGRPTDRPEDSGSWSTGEFQVTLEDILSPRTAARFTPRGQDRIANRPAFVFDLTVDQPHSHWTLEGDNGKRYKPAYTGTIWIDKETRRVLRIEQVATSIPRDLGFDKEETSLEYGFVSIEGRSYLLPVQSLNEACQAGGSTCSRNKIEFRNYRKFTADSSVTFGN
jgi:hypothetical protein